MCFPTRFICSFKEILFNVLKFSKSTRYGKSLSSKSLLICRNIFGVTLTLSIAKSTSLPLWKTPFARLPKSNTFFISEYFLKIPKIVCVSLSLIPYVLNVCIFGFKKIIKFVQCRKNIVSQIVFRLNEQKAVIIV